MEDSSVWSQLSNLPKPRENQFLFKTGIKNSSKNRWNNIVPYELTRVKLQSGKYIEANWIDVGCYNRLIACSAPVVRQFTTFWEMIWEYSVSFIGVLTDLEEKFVVKADKYWPDTNTPNLTFGDILVELESLETSDYFEFSHLVLKREGETRKLYHVHIKKWSDFDIPQNINSLKHVIGAQSHLELNPIVIHCSAGCGRTGVVAAVIRMINTGESSFQAVNNIRKFRRSMVSNEKQFVFIDELYEKFKHLVQQK